MKYEGQSDIVKGSVNHQNKTFDNVLGKNLENVSSQGKNQRQRL